jgi:hypothetical protein
MNTMSIAFMNAGLWTPTIVLNFSEKFIILHHPCTARFVMIQTDKSPISES